MGCGIQGKTPVDGDYCFTRKISRKLRDHSSDNGITAYDIYHQLHQEYNKAGPDRNGKGKDPVYAKPGKQLERTIWLRRMESFRTAKSHVQPSRRGASRSHGTVEIINTIEHSDIREPKGNGTPSVLSLQTTRSMATVFHSILDVTGACNWTTEETVLSGPLEGLHLIDDDNDNDEDDSHRGATRFSGEHPRKYHPISQSSEIEGWSPLMHYNRTVIEESLNEHQHKVGFTSRRLKNELQKLAIELQNNAAPNFLTLSPISADNILEWQATIQGPPDTPYEFGVFHVCISLTGIDYPSVPPRMWFHTKVYHPNIDEKGAICADFLDTGTRGWTPAYTLQHCVMCLLLLLQDPCSSDPLMPEIAYQKKFEPMNFERLARKWTRLYATPGLQE